MFEAAVLVSPCTSAGVARGKVVKTPWQQQPLPEQRHAENGGIGVGWLD